MVFRGHVNHRATADHGGHPVAEQGALGHQNTRRAGAADKLVRGQEYRIQRVLTVHVDSHVGTGGGVVPAGQRTVCPQQPGHGRDIALDSGDIGGGGKAADQQGAVGVPLQCSRQRLKIDAALRVQGNDFQFGNALAPGQFVGVMLVGTDEYHRPFLLGKLGRQLAAGVQLSRQPQVHHIDQLVDRGGGS